MIKLTVLNDYQRSEILLSFVKMLEEKNKDCGTIFGSYQILEIIEDIAIEKDFLVCPRCKRSCKK
jgi:hypothetical protein